MLEDILRSYRKKAEEVNWKKYNKNDLFFEYIKNENNIDVAEAFFAGIVCRYWGYSGRIFNKCNKHIPFEECVDCVIDSIIYVLNKRVWENESSSLYNDPAAPDKAMHIAMKRQQAIMLSKYTATKRLSNFNTLSFDAAHEEYKDSADGLFLNDDYFKEDKMKSFINDYFINDDYLSGLFLDAICYNVIKYNTKNIIKYIKNIDDKDLDYYLSNYDINRKKFIKLINSLKTTTNEYMTVKLNSLLYSLRKENLFNA